jgi:hypothetical protein
MTQQNLLPKFGGEKAAETRAAETVPPAAAAAPEPSVPPPTEHAVGGGSAPFSGAEFGAPAKPSADEAGGNENNSGPARAAAFARAAKQLRPFSGWPRFKNLFGRFLAREGGTEPRQIELSLDLVKPVRNDLRDFKPDGA